MKKKRIKSVFLLIAFMSFGMSVFAQTTTLKVMKNGVVVYQSEVLEIEKMVFQDPSGSPTAPSNDALVVNKTNNSTDETLLDDIDQLTFSNVNLSVKPFIGSNSVYPFSEIAKLTFEDMTKTGISNPQVQSLEVIAYVNSEGNIEVKCAAEIKSLRLFTVDGRTVATVVETGHAPSLQNPPAGIYLLAVETTQGTVVKKIVKY